MVVDDVLNHCFVNVDAFCELFYETSEGFWTPRDRPWPLVG